MMQQKTAESARATSREASSPVKASPMTDVLFLFRWTVIDMLKHCKSFIKMAPFDDMDAESLVQSNNNRNIDIYHQYFLMGIGHNKAREFVCNKYSDLVSNNLINKNFLPPNFITSIINARNVGTGAGGSTAGSGGNSIVGSAMNLSIDKSVNIGKLISTIICHTIQPSSQIAAGLFYLVQGTRNKNNSAQFIEFMEQTYTSLKQFRKKPIDRFISHFVTNLVHEVEYHQKDYLEYERKHLKQFRELKKRDSESKSKIQKNYKKVPSIMIEKQRQKMTPQIPKPPHMFQYVKPTQKIHTKEGICKHEKQKQQAKFGKCFVCQRDAGNYDKVMFVPLCGMSCKAKLQRLNQECLMDDHFNFMKWLLQTLNSANWSAGNGDQILYMFLVREIEEQEKLSQKDIKTILQIIVSNFSLQAIGITVGIQAIQTNNNITMGSNKIIQNSALVMSHLVRKYTHLMLRKNTNKVEQQIKQKQQKQQKQQNAPSFFHTKVTVIQMVRMLQSLPIVNNSLQLSLLKSLIEIIAAKQATRNIEKIKRASVPLVVLKQFYINCDCKILQTNLVERILNLISQYALNSNVTPSSVSNSSASVGTYTSLSMQSANTLTLGNLSNSIINGNSCVDNAIAGLQQILSTLVLNISTFDTITNDQNNQQQIQNLIKQKKIKKYIQSKFVQDFNKKPTKAVQKLRKLFNYKISAKDIAMIIRQNMDYETKIKKSIQKINKQQVGTYFGTAKKDKNFNQPDFNQAVYWQFLKLLQGEYAGKQIDDCLRITFNAFMMPKEGQQVEVVLGPLSLILQPFIGLIKGNQATATYQLIMVSLMVQTSNNPNVKQNEKLKFDGFKKFCSDIDKDLTQARMTSIYDRIKKRPLQILMQYKGIDVFNKKYLASKHYNTSFWENLEDLSQIIEKPQSQQLNQSTSTLTNSTINTTTVTMQKQNSKQQKVVTQKQQEIQQSKQQKIQSKNSINLQSSQILQNQQHSKQSLLAFALLNSWQFVYMTLVNKNNLRGLEQACILYGKSQLITQFNIFFNHLYKLFKDYEQKSSSSLQSVSQHAKLTILKLAIDYSNYVIGRNAWLIIIKIIYKLDYIQKQTNTKAQNKRVQSSYAYYEYEASDKIFTRTNTFKSVRLKQFLEAMCEFSSSDVKTDKTYTREMYILHHIAEIIQYNLQRFQNAHTHNNSEEREQEDNVWNVVWPTIRNYFRNICVHPRKEIAMSAIDSYKQLTMKMLKLNPVTQAHISHNELMDVYLHVFERSPSYIKDLIINVLLNVVSRDLKSGWEQLYTILEISDSQDKTIVMKVVHRLIQDIGISNIGNLLRLHQILIKQLRIASEESYNQIMERLWEICEYFNRLDVWIETLAKIKDIYKSTSDVNILSFMYRICNYCIDIAIQNQHNNKNNDQQINQEQHKMNEKNGQEEKTKKHKNKRSHHINHNYKLKKEETSIVRELQDQQQQLQRSMQHIEQQISQKYIKKTEELYLNNNNEAHNNKDSNIQQILKAQQIHKLIYFEIFSVQMHILQIKAVKLFASSVNAFKILNIDVFFRNLGSNQTNKTGFTSLWEMFLSCPNNIQFCYFLHEYFAIIFDKLANIEYFYRSKENQQKKQSKQKQKPFNQFSIKSLEQLNHIKRQILLWLIRIYLQTTKDQVLQLSQEDPDLDKSFKQILQQKQSISGKADLIQFYLSSKEYEAQAIQHLVFLKIFKIYYDSQSVLHQKLKNQSKDKANSTIDLHSRILQIVVESYQTASQVNNKPLLRNFLWNNQFFKGQQYLPGLMKQQLRSFQLIIKYFDFDDLSGKVYKLIYGFITNFIEKAAILSAKYGKNSKKKQQKKQQNIKLAYQNLDTIHVPPAQSEQLSKIIQILYQDLGLWITNAEQVLLFALRKIATQIKNEKECINKKQIFDSCVELCRVATNPQVTLQCSLVLQELILKMF